MHDYDISDKKKIRNKNIEYNFSGNNKHSKHGDHTSDDNKKRNNNKDNKSPNNNCYGIKNNFSNNKKRSLGRPLTSEKSGKNSNQIGLERNISIINKQIKNNGVEDYFNENKRKKIKKGNNYQKNDNASIDNIKFSNKIDFTYEINDKNNDNKKENNKILYNKETLLNERIKYFKIKCINNLKEEKYNEAYNYLVKIKNNKRSDINNRDIRENLIKILGKDNITYWYLIDQIILFEEILNDRQ